MIPPPGFERDQSRVRRRIRKTRKDGKVGEPTMTMLRFSGGLAILGRLVVGERSALREARLIGGFKILELIRVRDQLITDHERFRHLDFFEILV